MRISNIKIEAFSRKGLDDVLRMIIPQVVVVVLHVGLCWTEREEEEEGGRGGPTHRPGASATVLSLLAASASYFWKK